MDLDLTDEQIKAAKAVYRAMRKASKLGVVFWDNYGTLQCYNAEKITCPVPDSDKEISMWEHDPTYSEILDNFRSGNADDELFYDRV
jgi:hypothetical protein